MSRVARERLALVSILLAALALRAWGLEQNGWGAEYYSAAVFSMAGDWRNFLFAAFDPAGFISVDKPPVALWLQVLSVKLLGFRPFALLFPQVLAGVASVWLLYHLVRRRFGAQPALIAALLLATTPVWVAVNRTNNMDSVLVLALLLAAWALLEAVEKGNRRYLLLAMAGIGIAFNVKMLAAYIVLPTFFLVYALAAPLPWKRRAIDLAWASVVLVAVSLPWALVVEFTPADQRPYVGSSRNNSMLELVVGHNAMRRFMTSREPESTAEPSAASRRTPVEALPAEDLGADTRSSARALVQRAFVRAPTGPLRLASGQLAAQVAWLLPLALAGVALGAGGGLPASPSPGKPVGPARAALLFWSAWAVTCWIVYGYLGGIVHFYYLSTLAPAFAAMAGIGVSALWERYREAGRTALLLPLVLVLCALWQLHVQASAMGWSFASLWTQREPWLGWMQGTLVGGTTLAVTSLAIAAARRTRGDRVSWLAKGSIGLGLAALLVLPLAWTLSSVLLPGHGVMPSADLYRLLVDSRAAAAMGATRFGKSADTSTLISFLKTHRDGERYLLATSTTQLAAPVIIETGEAVMARGGFHGLDAALTPEKFAAMVQAKQVRFAMLGDVAAVSRRMGAGRAGRPVADWIRNHGKLVDSSLWRGQRMAGSMELYDLRPEEQDGLHPVP